MQVLHPAMVHKMPLGVLVVDLHTAWRQRVATSSVLLLAELELVYSQAALSSVQELAQLNNQGFSSSVQCLNLAVSVVVLLIPFSVQVQVLLLMIHMRTSL